MNFIPKRRRAPKMNCNEPSQIRSPGHLRWVRGFRCSVENTDCSGRIEAAHVRIGTDGGTGVKPGDNWAVPLCAWHHRMQHKVGERSFENGLNIDLHALAKALWNKSPHRSKLTRTAP